MFVNVLDLRSLQISSEMTIYKTFDFNRKNLFFKGEGCPESMKIFVANLCQRLILIFVSGTSLFPGEYYFFILEISVFIAWPTNILPAHRHETDYQVKCWVKKQKSKHILRSSHQHMKLKCCLNRGKSIIYKSRTLRPFLGHRIFISLSIVLKALVTLTKVPADLKSIFNGG